MLKKVLHKIDDIALLSYAIAVDKLCLMISLGKTALTSSTIMIVAQRQTDDNGTTGYEITTVHQR